MKLINVLLGLGLVPEPTGEVSKGATTNDGDKRTSNTAESSWS